jgi:predicted hotdog family 3-hydroxylacyl-ACP dehydratase
MSDTRAPAYPEIARLIPHAEPMRLLSRVLDHDAESTTCLVEPDDHVLFHDADGRVPTWLGIEYMAQCIAAHAGLEVAERGSPPRIGYLLGSRSVRFHSASLPASAPIEVSARHLRGRPGLGAMSFACEVVARGGAERRELVAEGTLNVALAPAPTDAESKASP